MVNYKCYNMNSLFTTLTISDWNVFWKSSSISISFTKTYNSCYLLSLASELTGKHYSKVTRYRL